MLFSGADAPTFLERLSHGSSPIGSARDVVAALLHPWMPLAVEAMDASLRDEWLGHALDMLPPGDPGLTPALHWLQQRSATTPSALAPPMRARLAESRLLALDLPGARALVTGLQGPLLDLIEAARLTLDGDWPAASALFEQAIKRIRQASGTRRGALSSGLMRLYLLGLLAQTDPKAWLTRASTRSANPAPAAPRRMSPGACGPT